VSGTWYLVAVTSPLSIVTVCTGNICRSPAMELLFARQLADAGVTVSSAGTHAMKGHGIPAPMLRCLDADGIDGTAHLARQYTEAIARKADLIVCATAQHRAWCVREAPFALKRTFTLGELAEAARRGAPLEGGLAGVARAVSDYRTQLAGVKLIDVPDPYYESQDFYNETYALMSEMITDVTDWMKSS